MNHRDTGNTEKGAQGERWEIIATLSQADVREFEKLDPKVLGKLTRWIGCLEDLLNWLGNNAQAESYKDRELAIETFLEHGKFVPWVE